MRDSGSRSAAAAPELPGGDAANRQAPALVPHAADEVTAISVDVDVPATMRDGTVLRANVYRPAHGGTYPTLLARLPYGKDGPVLGDWLDPLRAARAGFVVAVQDTRGRFRSEGEWMPFRFERTDGHDSVEWAARLPGSNGRVGMFGPSYLGNTQWMAAVARPDCLAAIAPGFSWSEPLDGLFARGGALELGLASAWTLETGAGELARRFEGSAAARARSLAQVLADYDRLASDGYWELPASAPRSVIRHGVPDIGTFSMAGDPSVPDRCRVAGSYDQVKVPSFHVAGWYDVFVQGTLDNFVAMRELGRPARLLVGPWTHAADHDPVGELAFGALASRRGAPSHPGGDLVDVQLGWFRRRLAAAGEVAEEEEAPVRIFVMGRNVWRDEPAWPLARARPERWFLRSHEGLSRGVAEPGDRAATEFAYDPADPVPTIGGATVMVPGLPAGPRDQRPLEARADVCVFTSPPLEADLEVTGRVRAELAVDSSAVSTDWVVRLCDVHPDGRSINLCDGIVRVGPGERHGRVTVDLWSTSNVFGPGHRVRVHVTSSSFPRWDRNLNTGDQLGTSFVVARQRLHHGSERASWIELPVVERNPK